MSRETSHRCSRERRRVVENVFSRRLALKKKSTNGNAQQSHRAKVPSHRNLRIRLKGYRLCANKRELDIYNILTPMLLCVFSVLCRCAGISTFNAETGLSLLDSSVCLVFFYLFCELSSSARQKEKLYTKQQQHKSKIIFKLRRVINKNN